jgi:hypothetical protein
VSFLIGLTVLYFVLRPRTLRIPSSTDSTS